MSACEQRGNSSRHWGLMAEMAEDTAADSITRSSTMWHLQLTLGPLAEIADDIAQQGTISQRCDQLLHEDGARPLAPRLLARMANVTLQHDTTMLNSLPIQYAFAQYLLVILLLPAVLPNALTHRGMCGATWGRFRRQLDSDP